MYQPWLSLDTRMSRLGSVSSFHVSSCLVPHNCVLSVSLSGTGKCLLCDDELIFLAESRPLGPFPCCLLTCCKTIVLVVVVVLWL